MHTVKLMAVGEKTNGPKSQFLRTDLRTNGIIPLKEGPKQSGKTEETAVACLKGFCFSSRLLTRLSTGQSVLLLGLLGKGALGPKTNKAL